MSIIRHDALQYTDTPNGNAAVAVATASRGATEVSVIRQRQRAGGFNPPHTHDREEVLVLLAGSLDVTMGGETHTLGAGDTVVVPARTEHQLRNVGADTAEWLLIAPAGYRFYHASGEEASPEWAR
ncbi:MAG TPA: cupin domain-containing protein [Thermomicrobiales bacterium]|nr:cupin domain-containing protein [Thermomicrobiales bacterium]